MSSLSLIDPFSSNSTSVPKSKPTLNDFNSEFDSPAPAIKQSAASAKENIAPAAAASLSLTPLGKKHSTQTLFPKFEKKQPEPMIIEEASPPAAAAEPKLFKEEKLNHGLVELNEANHATRELSAKLHNVLIEKINLTKSSCDKNIELTKEAIEHICNSTRSATTAFNETVAKAMEAQKACMLQFVTAAQEFGNWVHKESRKLSSKKRKQRDDERYASEASEEDDEGDTPMSASGSEESDPDPVDIIEEKRKRVPVASSRPPVTKRTIEQSSKKAKAAPASAKPSPLFKPTAVANGRQLPVY